jgi:RimJ/RimL family protein N-acetyltransferase
MFTLNSVTIRPLATTDLDIWYTWEYTIEHAMLGGWTQLLARTAFQQKFEQRINEPKAEMKYFAIDYHDQFIGVLQLAGIDHFEQHAVISIVIGPKDLWGRGIGSTALRLLLDYAFTVQGLERITSEVYGFNTRSQRLMERVGFQKEGILRQHERANGKRQDLHVYGILKPEFYERYPTIFTLPE